MSADVVGNANDSSLSREKRTLRADQVSVEYRPSVSRVSAECRSSVVGLAIEYPPTCILVERPPISTNISIECQSIYWSSVDRYIDGEMSLVHKTRSVVRAPDRCTGGHGFDSRWELNFFCRHARDKLNISQSSLCGEFFRVRPGEDIFELLPILL